MDLHREIAARDSFRKRCHLTQILDHAVESARQFADLVLRVNLNLLIQVAGVADFGCDRNELA